MTQVGVILYGPPAVGKDTITAELVKLGPFVHYHRLKHGPGRTTGYRMINDEQLAKLRATPGEIIYENHRYNATYIIDRTHLADLLNTGQIPVIHLGQPEAAESVAKEFPQIKWLIVELTCPRHVALSRITERSTGDIEDRIQAYDRTATLTQPSLRLNTNETTAAQSATCILAEVHRHRFPESH